MRGHPLDSWEYRRDSPTDDESTGIGCANRGLPRFMIRDDDDLCGKRSRTKRRVKLGADTGLVSVSAIVFRNQLPKMAIKVVQPGIVLIDDFLSVLGQPQSDVFKRARASKILAGETFQLSYERHGALHDV